MVGFRRTERPKKNVKDFQILMANSSFDERNFLNLGLKKSNNIKVNINFTQRFSCRYSINTKYIKDIADGVFSNSIQKKIPVINFKNTGDQKIEGMPNLRGNLQRMIRGRFFFTEVGNKWNL